MNDETLKFIKIIISKGSSFTGGSARGPRQVACGEGDIQHGRVFGDGEGGESGDEEKEEGDMIGRRFVIMKSLIGFLTGVAILLSVFSVAAVPKEPLASGEIRLISMDVVGAGVEANSSFAVNVFFEATGNPKIKRACFYEPREKPSCFDVSDISYLTLGTKKAFQVNLPGLNLGSHRVECYAEYIRDGETRKTNVVFTQIITSVTH